MEVMGVKILSLRDLIAYETQKEQQQDRLVKEQQLNPLFLTYINDQSKKSP